MSSVPDDDIKSKKLNWHHAASGAKKKKYLIFSLLDETYGIPLSSVKEVIGITEITKLPNMPDFFRGLINLRGQIISVVDLRAKLNLPPAVRNEKKNCNIILEIDDFTLGVIVDDVSAVAAFMPNQIESNLDVQSQVNKEFVVGVAKTENKKLTLLLDAARVLSADEFKLVKSAQQAA